MDVFATIASTVKIDSHSCCLFRQETIAMFFTRPASRKSSARVSKAANARRRKLFFESLEDRRVLAINAAIVQDIGAGDTARFVATRDQLNNDTFFDFNATLVNSPAVDTLAELNTYDVVIVGNNGGGGSDAFSNVPFTSALKDWVLNHSGGVVMTGWGIFGAGSTTPPANPDIDAIIPVNTSGNYNYFSAPTAISLSGGHPITNGLGAVLSLTGSGNYVEFPASGPQVDAGATVLGTISGNPVVVAAQENSGRGVYLGPIYSGYSGYNTSPLRTGAADQLLEQAVQWAANIGSTVVAQANGPYTINEGQPLNLSASGSTAAPGSTYEWDVDGDGDFDENITGQTVTVTWAQLQALGMDDGPQTNNVTVRLTEPGGGGGGGGSVEYVTNGTFESGNTSGWTINTTGSGQWVVNNGSFDPASPGGPTSPLAGSFDVVSNQTFSSTQFLSQPIVVPAGVTSATLSWLDRIQSYATFFDPVQEFRVLVLNSGGGLIQEIYSTNPGDPTTQFGPNSRSFNVTSLMQSLAGQSIQLSFQVEDLNFYFNVNLDNISLQMTTGGGGGGGSGTIFVADINANQVVAINPSTGAQTIVSSGGNFVTLMGIEIESSGQLVVAGHDGSQNVTRVHPTTGAQSLVTTGLSFPHSMALDGTGQIIVASHSGMIRVNPTTGAQTFLPGSSIAEDLEVESSGNIVYALGDGMLRRFNPSTSSTTIVSSGFSALFGVAIAGSGQIYVTDYSSARVVRVDPVSGAQTVISSGGLLTTGIRDIEIDASGNLLVADAGFQRILKIDPTTGAQSIVSSGVNLVTPWKIAIDVGSGSGGGVDTDTTTLTINNVSPTITSFVTPSLVLVGTPINLSAAATDPAGAADPLSFTWTITRPDLSTFTLGGTSPSFIPTQQGSYGISLVVDDGDLGTDTATSSIDVTGTFVTLSGSDLLIQDNLAGGKNDDLRVSYDPVNDWFDIFDPVNLLFVDPLVGSQVDSHHIRVPRGNFSGNILVNTLEGDDLLTVDSSMVSSGRPVFYDGGDPTSGPPGDALALSGPGVFANITHTFWNASDGNVMIDGYPVNYLGLEPVIDTITATTRTFTFTGAGETVTLADDATTGNTLSVISSTLGESVTFANPTGSLTVNLTSGSDTLNFNSLDSQEAGPATFSADLTISGDGGDTVNFPTAMINLGAGTANIGTTGGQPIQNINFTGGGLQTTASVFLTGTGSISDFGAGVVPIEIVALNLVAVAPITVSLDTNVFRVEIEGGTGGVDIEDTNDLIVGGIGSVFGISATGGGVSVVTNGTLTVNEDVMNSGGGSVTLNGNGAGGGFAGSAWEILANNPGAPSGVYTIDPDGAGASAPVNVYADMVTDGGGWTLVASTLNVPLMDHASIYYSDLTTISPTAGHDGIWNGMRPVATGNTDIRFSARNGSASGPFTVDLAFYNIQWYDERTSSFNDFDIGFEEGNGAGQTLPPPARRNLLNGDFRPLGDQWYFGYLEGEDSAGDTGDFSVDFDDRGMDSNQSDGTDWGQDDGSPKKLTNNPLKTKSPDVM